jgi:hypothetical protein
MTGELVLQAAEALAPLLWPPSRSNVASAWYGHVPFGHWLVCSSKPRLLVELGTRNGVSYAAFCEAVFRMRLPTACFAVDTWRGDEHSGFYGEEVFEDLARFNSSRYAAFSELLRTTFDDAASFFKDNSIDLLHIDGCHSYEAVKHDFEFWLPKLSEEAVVLLHDTISRERGFGVWRLFLELRERWPAFEFMHNHGLGVIAVGAAVPGPVAALCALDGESANSVRERFASIGQLWANQNRGAGRVQNRSKRKLFNWSEYDLAYYAWQEYRKNHIGRREALEIVETHCGADKFFRHYALYKIIKPFRKLKKFLIGGSPRLC